MVNSDEGWAVGAQTSSAKSQVLSPLELYFTMRLLVEWERGVSFLRQLVLHLFLALESVFMLNQYEGWAVGDDATILHYTVSGGIGTWSLDQRKRNSKLITIRKLDFNIHVVTYKWLGRRRNFRF